MERQAKRYLVDFYNTIDGWVGSRLNDRLFNTLEEARALCDKLQAELPEDNKKYGEHYGIIDLDVNREVRCARDPLYNKPSRGGLLSIGNLKSQYENMSDTEFASLKEDDLVDEARLVYSVEAARRNSPEYLATKLKTEECSDLEDENFTVNSCKIRTVILLLIQSIGCLVIFLMTVFGVRAIILYGEWPIIPHDPIQWFVLAIAFVIVPILLLAFFFISLQTILTEIRDFHGMIEVRENGIVHINRYITSEMNWNSIARISSFSGKLGSRSYKIISKDGTVITFHNWRYDMTRLIVDRVRREAGLN